MGITIRDIAKKAGVSPATVSLVLNNKRGVGEDTREHVKKIIRESGYQHPRNNKKRRHVVVLKYRKHGMALEENQGFIASIVDHIEKEATASGMRLLVLNCDRNNIESTLSRLEQDGTDGIIFIGTELSSDEYFYLEDVTLPLVIVDNSMRYERYDSVVMDNMAIARAAVNYLYKLGHREIFYFKSNRQIDNLDERDRGYREALQNLGLTVPEPILLPPTLNGAYEEMKSMIHDQHYRPSGAAFADNDSVAIGAMRALHEAGFKIPETMSVIGVDDIPYSAISVPTLTTVRVSRYAMGSLALCLLDKRMNHYDTPPIQIMVAGTLIERESTRKVPPKSSLC